MAEITLGYDPHTLTVRVVRGVDFFGQITYGAKDAPEDWPDGAALEIRNAVTDPWEAVLAGPVATWDIDRTVVNELLDTEHRRAELWFTADGEDPIMWAVGKHTEKVLR